MKKITFLCVTSILIFMTSVDAQYYYNRALNLPGTAGNYSAAPSSTALEITGNFTLECWLYPTSPSSPTVQNVIAKRLSGSTGYEIYLNSGKVALRTSGSTRLTGKTALPANVWSHVAGTFNATTFTFSIYINGVLDTSLTSTTGAPAANTDSLYLGKGINSPYVGFIDEVRIWNIERTAADIQSTVHMPLGLSAASGPYTGIVAAWRFNTVQGSTGTEEINGNVMYLRGAAAYVDLSNKPNNHLAFNTGIYCTGAATGTCVSIPYSPLLYPTTAITLEIWVWQNNAAVQVLAASGSSNYPYRIVKSLSNTFRVFLNGAAPGSGNYGGIIPNSKWTHLAFTYNVSTQTYAYYMNGVQTQTGTMPLTFGTATNPLELGGGTGVVTFNGMLDEFRVSNFVKTPEQIKSDMFVSVDTNNAPTGTNYTLAYNFEGTLADYADGGPKGTFAGTLTGIRFTNTWNSATEYPIVTDRWDAGSFGNGYRFNAPGLAFGQSPTTITDSIFMPQNLTISDLNVFVAAHHDYANDISISVKNPAGTTTRILYPGGNPAVGRHMITIFDDAADSTIGGLAPWAPRIKPVNTLAVFNGQSSAGWWKIVLTDIFPGADNGTLMGWGIQFNNQVITGTGNPIANETPLKYSLSQNYPNPFNPVTTIKYSIAKDEFVKITVYDITGKVVETLVNEMKKAGKYSMTINGSNLASGVYFYKLEAGQFTDVRKMILVK